jgi:hypothetical protein
MLRYAYYICVSSQYLSNMTAVPIVCAECGWKLGLGNPGALVPCARCGCWVYSRAAAGDLEAVVTGLAVVGVAAVAAVGIIALIKALSGGEQ